MTIAFFLALIILPVLTQVITRNDFEDLFGYALYPDYADYSENCVCVPYWQCKEDYSDLIDDGIDIMDTRLIKPGGRIISCAGKFDVCCQVDCGRQNTGAIARIFNKNSSNHSANHALFGEFPWMLGILHNKVFKCGGSLIHPQVVMTAAHCVSPREKYLVRAGEWNWETKTETLPHEDQFSKEIIIHPGYRASTLQNDIALLILEKPFRLSENVGVICIPSQHFVISSKKCVASGWGKDSFNPDKYQSILKKIPLPIIPNHQCNQLLRNKVFGPYFKLDKQFMCAGGETKKDTCKGDGGGPLVCPIDEESGRYQQVGIVSWGLTCGSHESLGVYLNVALFSDWIDHQMIRFHLDRRIYKTNIPLYK